MNDYCELRIKALNAASLMVGGVEPQTLKITTAVIPSTVPTPVWESDYEKLTNKPKINSVTLIGDKSFADLGLPEATNLDIDALFLNTRKEI